MQNERGLDVVIDDDLYLYADRLFY